jgi:hypothetical protein
VGWGEFLRVQILLDVTKPLSRGRMITLKQKSSLGGFSVWENATIVG